MAKSKYVVIGTCIALSRALTFLAPVVSYASDFIGTSWRYENGVPVEQESTETGEGDVSLLSVTAGESTGWGIDVSEWQSKIDWAKVKAAGVDFAVIRCGWADDGTDARFVENVKACIENDIPFGIYLYSYAWDAISAAREAAWTLSLLKKAGLSPSDLALPVYFDFENTTGGKPSGIDAAGVTHYIQGGTNTYTAMVVAYCETIEAAGYDTGVYASLSWWNNYLTSPILDRYDRWVAQWYSRCQYDGDVGLWQYTSSGSVDGISGNVDMNYSYAALGTGGGASAAVSDNSQAMYRLYNPNSGEHFYTAQIVELASLVSVGWTYEGVGWTAPLSSATPVYRLYNSNVDPQTGSGEHHYTTSAAERDNLVSLGWHDEGVGWYSADADTGVTLYRQYNPNQFNCNHNFTANEAEKEALAKEGWTDEGIAWYGLSS